MYSVFNLPRELKEEIFSYSSVRDIEATFDAYGYTPSCKDLYDVAMLHQLPNAVSFSMLISLQEEKDLTQRVEWCIVNNEVDSFQRLYPLVQAKYINLDFLTSFDEDYNQVKNPLRPKIARIVVERMIKEDEYEDYVFLIAARHKDYEMIKLMLELYLHIDSKHFYHEGYTEKDTLELLKLLSSYPNYMEADLYDLWKDVLLHAIRKNWLEVTAFLLSLGPEERYKDLDTINMRWYKMSDEMLLLLATRSIDDKSIIQTAKAREVYHAIDLVVERNPDIYQGYYRGFRDVRFLVYLVKSGKLSKRRASIITQAYGKTQTFREWLGEEPSNWKQELEEAMDRDDKNEVLEISNEVLEEVQEQGLDPIYFLSRVKDAVKLFVFLIDIGRLSKNEIYKSLDELNMNRMDILIELKEIFGK